MSRITCQEKLHQKSANKQHSPPSAASEQKISFQARHAAGREQKRATTWDQISASSPQDTAPTMGDENHHDP
jgi:hypothetical protein